MKKFIEELKKIFPYNKSVAIELILALTFSHELPGNSVVLLTQVLTKIIAIFSINEDKNILINRK